MSIVYGFNVHYLTTCITAPEKSGPYKLVSYLAVVICVAFNRAPLEIIAGKYIYTF